MVEHDEVPHAARLRAVCGTLLIDAMSVEVISALAAVDVRSILLKGPTLASLLYPDGGRTYTDSDLLVRTGDVPRAAVVLSDLGFVANQDGYAASERDAESSTYTRRTSDGTVGIVDLHWNLHLAREPDRTWAVLNRERDEMTLGGIRVDVLNVAARALHVAMHAAQHGLLGPQRYEKGGQTGEDLRRALGVIDRDTWRRAALLAVDLGADEAFAFGLRLDASGARLADDLGLAQGNPDLWRFRTPFEVPRGALSVHRLVAAPTLNEKASTLGRSLVPSRARVRAVASSRIGRASLLGAYVEYWVDGARSFLPAVQSALALRRATRQRRGS